MRLWPRSLLWRTVVLLAVLLLVSQLAAVAVLQLSLAQPRLERVVEQVASLVNVTRAALDSADPARRRALLAELSAREGIGIRPDRGREPPQVRRRRPAVERLEQALRRRADPATRVVVDPRDGGSIRVRFDAGGQRYWLVLPRARLEPQRFSWRWLGWIAAVLAVAVAGAWLIVHRIGRPLERLAAAAAAIGRGEAPEPVPETGPQELRTLARSFNRMRDDLERLEADRRLLLAGVSHDLRTPLARLRLQAEMLHGEGTAAARDGIIEDVDEMDALIGQFLDFVREGTAEAPEPVDLDALAAETAERYARLGHPVKARAGGLSPVRLRPTAMRRLLANLVDNALAHGRAPGERVVDRAGEPVEIRTWAQGGHTCISVLDRGPGIDPGDVERLKQPFTRRDRDRAGAGGAGLGLAIADRIARAHGGRLELLMRAGGGLEARVTFDRG